MWIGRGARAKTVCEADVWVTLVTIARKQTVETRLFKIKCRRVLTDGDTPLCPLALLCR